MTRERRPDRPPAAEWVQAATDQLSSRTRLPTEDRNAKNQRSADESRDASQPKNTRRLPKMSTALGVSIIVGVIALTTIAAYFVGLTSAEKTEQPATDPAQMVTIPTNTPTLVTRIVTATPSPTWTPRPPKPTQPSTATRVRPAPTADLTSYYVNLFASCNGRYSGETKERRRAAAQSTLTQGLRTLSEIIDIVAEKCQ